MSALIVSEFELFSLFEMTPDLVCIAGKDGYFRKFNPAVVNKFGYTAKELMAVPILSFIHPEDLQHTRDTREKMLQGTPLLNFQNRYLTKSGKIIWLEWTSVYSTDKELVFAIAKDITIHKEAEHDIQLRYRALKNMAAHFKTSLEKDRKYLASELHEELAQLAGIIKIEISGVAETAGSLTAGSQKKLSHAVAMTDLLIDSIRRISYAISPGMIEDVGLNETLKWHCSEFSVLHGIPCHFESNYDESGLTQEIKLDFFRICQEALSNVMHHAEADEVVINIENTPEELYLCVSDNGKGFEPRQQVHGAGIKSMQGRVASIQGRFNILTGPGKGTRIEVSMPKDTVHNN